MRERASLLSVRWRYVGDGRWIMGLPARDLTEGDLAEVLEREGIEEEVVEGCGLYERVGENERMSDG